MVFFILDRILADTAVSPISLLTTSRSSSISTNVSKVLCADPENTCRSPRLFMDNEAGIKIEFCEKNFSSSNFKNICKTVAKKTPFLDVLPVTKWPESTQTISHLQHEI